MLNINKQIQPIDSVNLASYITSYSIVKDSTFINFVIKRNYKEPPGNLGINPPEEETYKENVLSFKVKISDITSNVNFDKQTIWVIDDGGLNLLDEDGIVPEKFIIPVLIKTHPLKSRPRDVINNDKTMFIMFFKTSNVEDIIFRVHTNIDNLQISGSPNEQINYSQETFWKDLFSSIQVETAQTTVNPGDNIVVNISCGTNVDVVFLEPIVGYLPKTRVNIVNGKGSFIIKTDGLTSGDIVSVKLGYKYFTGAAVFTKTLA